jgi:hypothetical protein
MKLAGVIRSRPSAGAWSAKLADYHALIAQIKAREPVQLVLEVLGVAGLELEKIRLNLRIILVCRNGG